MESLWTFVFPLSSPSSCLWGTTPWMSPRQKRALLGGLSPGFILTHSETFHSNQITDLRHFTAGGRTSGTKVPPGPPTQVHTDQSLSQLLQQTRAQTHSCRFNSGPLSQRESSSHVDIPTNSHQFPGSVSPPGKGGVAAVQRRSPNPLRSRRSGSYLRCSSSRWTQRTVGPEDEDTFLSAAPADTLAELGQPQQTTGTVHIRQRLQNNVIKLDQLQNEPNYFKPAFAHLNIAVT